MILQSSIPHTFQQVDDNTREDSPYLEKYLIKPDGYIVERSHAEYLPQITFVIDNVASRTEIEAIESLFGRFDSVVVTSNEPSLFGKIDAFPISRSLGELINKLMYIFELGEVEYSMTSETFDFTEHIRSFIDEYQRSGVDALESFIESCAGSSDLIADALSTVGKSEEMSSYDKRFRLVIHNLLSPSAKIRYGAILGLASIKDVRAVPFVETAIEEEQDKIIYHALNQLKERLTHNKTIMLK